MSLRFINLESIFFFPTNLTQVFTNSKQYQHVKAFNIFV